MSELLKRLNQFEPARLRAFWIALVALLASLGIAVGTDIDTKVTAVIGVLAVIWPMIQGELTRSAVYAPATVEQIKNELSGTTADDDDENIPADEMNDEAPVQETPAEYGSAGPVDNDPVDDEDQNSIPDEV